MQLMKKNLPHASITRKAFILVFLLLSIVCSDFRLEKSLKLTSITNMVKVTALENDTLAVKSSDSTVSTVTILQGANFEKKVSEFVSNVDESQIEITQNGVVINDGTSLAEKSFTGQSKVFDGFKSLGNMIVNPKYALVVPTGQPNPSVIKIDLSTLTSELVVYKPVDDWKTRTPSYMHYMENGNILFGMGYNLFIVDSETLNIKQIIPKGNPQNHQVLFISSYFDNDKGGEIIIYERDRVPDEMSKYTVLEFNKEAQKYVEKDAFYTEAFSPHIYPSSLNGGVSISYNYQVYYWQSFHSVLSIDYNPNDTISGRDPVAVSYGQSLIVLKDQGGNFEFYDVSDDLDISRLESVAIGKKGFKKGTFTSDDNWVFISTQDIDNNEWRVFKVNVETYTFQTIKDSDENQINQLDFHVFDAGSNRFITLAMKDTSNYEIQLRNLDNTQIINKFQLGPDFFDAEVKDIKLISSLDWGLRFSIAAQYKKGTEGSNDSIIYQFDIQQDKIIKLDLLTYGNYTNLCACSKYLINYLAQKQKVTLQSFDDFSLAKAIDVADVNLGLQIEKNTLILTSKFRNNKIVYNLKESLESIGMFYLQHYTTSYTAYCQIILPSKQIFFQYSKAYRNSFPTRVFYSMQPPNLKQITIIQDSEKPYHSAHYYLSKQEDGTKCNQIYYIQYDHQEVDEATSESNQVWYFDPTFVRYRQCDKQFLKINLQVKSKVSFTKIFVSSDKKYLIIGLKNDAQTDFFMEIRLMSDPNKIFATQKFAITKDTDYYDVLDIDFVFDNKVIIHEEQKITVIENQHQSSASSFGVQSISSFDVNKDGIIAVAGPLLEDQTQTKMVVKKGDVPIFEVTIPEAVKSIVLSPNAKNLAIIDQNEEVGVWSTAGIVLYNEKKPGVKKIKFTQQAKLLIQTASSYEIVSFKVPHESFEKSSILASNYDVQVSKNGQFLAVIAERVVSIYENGAFLANYTVPVSNEQVVSVSFSPSNSLLIATSANNVYVLSTSACPETYHVDNFQCACSADLYPIDGACRECSFICSACEGSTSSCTSYSASFYILITASILVFMGLVIGGIVFYRRRKVRSQMGSSLMNDEEGVNAKFLRSIKAQRND